MNLGSDRRVTFPLGDDSSQGGSDYTMLAVRVLFGIFLMRPYADY